MSALLQGRPSWRPTVRGKGQARHFALSSPQTFSCPSGGHRATRKGFPHATPHAPQRRLPANPSQENLRKQAKRLAKAEGLRLAAAQRRLAVEYGHRTWADLMRAADASDAQAAAPSALSIAAGRADVAAVRAALAQGEPVNGRNDEVSTPLWQASAADAPAEQRIAVVRLLLDVGASPRQECEGRATPLHAAARVGPLALIELLIRGGALSWQTDRRGKTALDYARAGSAPDRDAIIELLDRPVMRDPNFRAAVRAIHTGDVDGLRRLLDQRPDLLRMRALEPDCYPRDYFRDPKLFWFIANNPTLMQQMPANIVAITQAMLERGVEQADLDYTLELVISNNDEIMHGHQAEVLATLLAAGAKATPWAIVVALAHWQLAPVRALLEHGLAMTAPIAAALGRNDELNKLLAATSADDRQTALGLAVINRQGEAARLCLDAGAEVNSMLPVHKHSTPLHQAAINDDLPMLELLVARGAKLDTRDTLWNGTPLGWAVHNGKSAAEAYLRSLTSP
jgi:peptide-methionine (S)-S-oxide reductase